MSPEVRARALKVVRRSGLGGVPALAEALTEDGDPSVRQFAAYALGRLGPAATAALPALARAADGDADAGVRLSAADAVARLAATAG